MLPAHYFVKFVIIVMKEESIWTKIHQVYTTGLGHRYNEGLIVLKIELLLLNNIQRVPDHQVKVRLGSQVY